MFKVRLVTKRQGVLAGLITGHLQIKQPSQFIFKSLRFCSLLLFTFTFCFLSQISEAQNAVQKKIDSLELILPSLTGTERFDVLRNLLRECIDVDNQKALIYAQEADSLIRSIGDSIRIKRFGRLYSQILRRTGSNSKALEVAKEALVVSRRDGLDEEDKKIYNTLAIAYIANAEYDEALSVLFEGLRIFEKDKNFQEMSMLLNNIGVVFFRIENYQKALNYYEESLTLKRTVNDAYGIDRILINMAQCNAALNKFMETIRLANEGLATCNNDCSEGIQSEGNFALGLAFFGLNRIPEALTHFKDAYTFSINSGDDHFRAESLIYLSKISAMSNDRKEALAHLTEAEEAAENNYESLLSVYKEFINVYKGNEKDIDKLFIIKDRKSVV